MAIDLIYRNRVESGAVKSVNGKTGEVVLTAEDVGAIPADSEIVDKVDLTYELASTANTNARKAYEEADKAQSMADNAKQQADEAYSAAWTNSDNMRRYFIRTPGQIEVGQTIKLASIEEDRTVWEAANFPSGGSGGEEWELIADIVTDRHTAIISVDKDLNGEPFVLEKVDLYLYSKNIDGETVLTTPLVAEFTSTDNIMDGGRIAALVQGVNNITQSRAMFCAYDGIGLTPINVLSNYNTNSVTSLVYKNDYNSVSLPKPNNVNNIAKIELKGWFCTGTIFKIYGVRKK